MVNFVISILSTTLLTTAWAQNSPKEIVLTQKSVAELVLQQGSKTKEVNLKYQQYRLAPAQALSIYDWKVLAETGYEFDKSTSLQSTTNPTNYTFERYKTSLTMQKPFTSGTSLGLELSRLSQQATYDGFTGTPPPSQQTLDNVGVTLEQALLGNILGAADRANVHSAELIFQANSVSRANELEDVVLQAIRQYWLTYVSQENFKEAVNSRDRYKKLVEAVKRKTSLGYSNPGDLPQVQAEFETREQKVKNTSAEYLANLENLITLLNLHRNTEIKFDIPKSLPPLPKLIAKNIEDLREIRSQKLRVEAAKEALTSAQSTSYPTLNAVGKLYSSGQDKYPDNSYSELASGTRPKFYVGMKFQYNFGSDLQTENIINKKLTKDLEETRLNRQFSEVQDRELQAERKVNATYGIALSAEKQKDFREKASQEINRSYTQGRTDISILITALNNFFDSEVQYSRAIGDYAIALNEWAAIRDELIPDDDSTPELKE